MMLCTNKRERVRETMDQTQTTRCVSRFEPLALRPRLHREGFLIHYLVHRGLLPREPPPRRICTTREYRTPLSNTTSQPRGRPVAKQPQHLYRRGLQTPTPPLTRGSKQQSQPLPKREQTNHPINLYQRGIQQEEGCLQLGGYNNLKQSLFPLNKDPNRIG